jgi:Ca2+-binding RTX toxin-like protein
MATIIGDEGDNFLLGTPLDDDIQGLGGQDILLGGTGEDNLDGGSGQDFLWGGGDNDILNGGVDADFLFGDGGQDTLDGDAGDDQLWGGADHDTLTGSFGMDTLRGGQGADVLIGVSPLDEQPGQLERDTLIGGSGRDTFVLGDPFKIYYDDSQVRFIIQPPPTEPPPSYGLITDFQPGQDTIQLKGAIEYELADVDLPNGVAGVGIFFDADQFADNGAEQLIGIIQSQQSLNNLQINLGRAITTIT